MFRTVDAEARSLTTANEIAALLRAEYVASGNRAYLHAASIALSRTPQSAALVPEATPEPV
ncbi:hypothetical protein Aab01nite_43050 [Paractinoplanes abujensis]|uniref:Uncharacterized protein n=1 Tax=Paractinoplanes abujensis TaxID=882441 RepID=A0A7W7CTG9_9ACTN|nr:hypothetical protein [Actinoplanes abujensis]MBB4694069.1 hypothetical protein [Actinoplanes abujensis]GID20715.1 hypothetical protein Aab01nite_43050 [Actinoplanes abujensis]